MIIFIILQVGLTDGNKKYEVIRNKAFRNGISFI
jgi:hypothetical protein